MSQHNFSINQLEEIVFNQSRCYADSEAFQICLNFVKKVNQPLYKDMLYKEAIACGGLKIKEELANLVGKSCRCYD